MVQIMSNVVELDAFKKENSPHAVGDGICILCKHEAVMVAPIGELFTECPECHTNKMTWRYPMDIQDTASWVCECGNGLFLIKPDGHFCPNCGIYNKY